MLNFDDTSKVSSSICAGNSISVQFVDEVRKRKIQLTFSKENSKIALTEVIVGFEILNNTFVNATGDFVNATVLRICFASLPHQHECCVLGERYFKAEMHRIRPVRFCANENE